MFSRAFASSVTATCVALSLASGAQFSASAGQPRPSVTGERLAGGDRYETAAAISRWAFPRGSSTVNLVRSDMAADGISSGMLFDGPVLLVPPVGEVPEATSAEITRLQAKTVRAIGDTNAISDAVLKTAAQGRLTSRLAGRDRYETASKIALRGPSANGLEEAGYTMAYSADSVPDGLVASHIPYRGTSYPIKPSGAVPPVIAETISQTFWSTVFVVGGSDKTIDTFLRRQFSVKRLAGGNRFDTAVQVARLRWNTLSGPDVVFLTRGDGFADALAAGPLHGGPLLFVPPTGQLPPSVAAFLHDEAPSRVVALGDATAVSDEMLSAARAAASR